MISFEDFISSTNEAKSQQELFDIFIKTVSQFGYDMAVYSFLTDCPSIDKKAGHGVLSSYPEEFMKIYLENGYTNIDPVVKYALTGVKAFSWGDMYENISIDKKNKKMMGEANEYKMLDGAAIAIYGANLEVAGIGLSTSFGTINPDKNTISMLRAIVNQFHLCYCEFERSNLNKNQQHIIITEREKEVLLWSAEGKTVYETAIILSISDATVKFHLQNIYRKLDVTDRTQAVVKAIKLMLINPHSVHHLKTLNIK